MPALLALAEEARLHLCVGLLVLGGSGLPGYANRMAALKSCPNGECINA
jgi:hypothetical protein